MEGNRKLAAILVADVAGYSRLMGDDEAATVRTLTEYRHVFVESSARHSGRVVDTAGDSVLAVFDSPVEAVECACDIQKALDRRNRQLAEHRRMQFRIGINLGDVIAREDGTVYGDGVNIASRLETLSHPGSVCVSGTVHDHVEGKVRQSFVPAGEHVVKNIAKPVRAYHVILDGLAKVPRANLQGTAEGHPVQGESAPSASRVRQSAFTSRTSLQVTVAMAFLTVLASSGAIWIWLRSAPEGSSAPMRVATIPLSGHAYPRRQASWFALSREGLLVYSIEGSTGPILSRRLDGPALQPLDGTSGGDTPFLSVDGQKMGFQRDGEMFVVPVSGGAAMRVKGAAMLAWAGRPAWTPDGRIIYTNEGGALLTTRPDGQASEQLTAPADGIRHLSPLVLPDGHTVLFTEVPGNVNDARIVALSVDQQRSRTLVSGGAITPQYADGLLFYCRPDGTLMAAPFDASHVELTGEARALPDRVDRSRFGVAHYAAAPGVLLYAPNAQTRLVAMDPIGMVTPLTEEGRWHMPRYSPDGTRIVFDRVTGAEADRVRALTFREVDFGEFGQAG